MTDEQAPQAKPVDAASAEVIDALAKPFGNQSELDRILDIPLTIHVELGRKKIPISRLLDIGSGHIVELDSAAGTPLSIYANNTLVAHGEAVVVGERYGVRVTDIVSPHERIKQLGGL
jgi:flagellar motor switch protein FliN/FliY